MKKIYLFAAFYLLSCVIVLAQHAEMHPEKVVVPVKSTFPLNPSPGTLFFDNTDKLMKYWNGTEWVSIAASTSTSAAIITFNITNQGISSYLIGEPTEYVSGSNANPPLTLYRGFTYVFNVQVSGHPFRISASDEGLGAPFTTGVTNQDAQSSQLVFKVPMDAPNTLYYMCMFHFSTMHGTINVK